MKATAIVIHSNKVLVQAFIAMAIAFLYSTCANAAPVKNLTVKKSEKTSAAAAQSALATKIGVDKEEGAKFGAKLAISTSAGVTDATETTENRSYTGAYVFTPSLSFEASNISISADIEYDREYSYQRDDRQDGDWVTPIIKLRKSYKELGVVDSLAFGPTVALPAGREMKRQTFNGSLGGSVAVEKKLSFLTLSQGGGYTYRFYEYDIRSDGTVNSPHLMSSLSTASIEITKWLSLGVEFTFQHLISFQKVNRSLTSTVFSGTIALSEKASISAGVATLKKGTIQTDGQSNRANLYDPGTAEAFLDLVLIF